MDLWTKLSGDVHRSVIVRPCRRAASTCGKACTPLNWRHGWTPYFHIFLAARLDATYVVIYLYILDKYLFSHTICNHYVCALAAFTITKKKKAYCIYPNVSQPTNLHGFQFSQFVSWIFFLAICMCELYRRFLSTPDLLYVVKLAARRGTPYSKLGGMAGTPPFIFGGTAWHRYEQLHHFTPILILFARVDS